MTTKKSGKSGTRTKTKSKIKSKAKTGGKKTPIPDPITDDADMAAIDAIEETIKDLAEDPQKNDGLSNIVGIIDEGTAKDIENAIDDMRKEMDKELESRLDERYGQSIMDPRCDYCKAPIYSGKAIKCHCGAILHQFCFNSHGMTKHQPEYTIIEVKTVSVYDDNGKYLGQRATYQEVANV